MIKTLKIKENIRAGLWKGYFSIVFLMLLGVGVTYTAFVSTAKILGSSFSVGSASIKLLETIGGGIEPSNLFSELPGPAFYDVSPYWTEDYHVQLYNNSTGMINLTTNAYYETANDPDDLRSLIYVEPIAWDDANDNGEVDSGELGDSYGMKTIIKWKTEGYDLGLLAPGEIMSLVLRFSTESVPESRQGSTGVFDFEFDSLSLD